MALDPQVAAILQQSAANPDAPTIADLPPEGGRAMYRAMSEMFDLQDVPIGKIEDRKIPGPAGEIPIRIYTPVAAGATPLPCLVFYHGGGFVIGDLETHDGACRALCNASGCLLIAVDYRLAPEHVFPAAVEDSFAALQWVAEHAAGLGVDPNRIAVGGDSAGGNLSAVVSQLARDNDGPAVAFQLLIYPATDADVDTPSKKENAEGYFLEQKTMDFFYGNYVPTGTDRTDPRLAPMQTADLSGLPPAYIVTAQFDPLRDEGRMYGEKMRAAGVPVEIVNYETMIHGFLTMGGIVDAVKPAIEAAGKAVKKALS